MTAKHVFLPEFGYRVTDACDDKSVVWMWVCARHGDYPGFAGHFAPWVQDTLGAWYRTSYHSGILTRMAEQHRGGGSTWIQGVKPQYLAAVTAVYRQLHTMPCSVIPRVLSDDLCNRAKRREGVDYIPLIVDIVHELDAKAGARLAARVKNNPDNVTMRSALKTWTNAYVGCVGKEIRLAESESFTTA